MSNNGNRENRIPQPPSASDDSRLPRAAETREHTFVRPDTWAPPEMLPMPKEDPDWVYRYVRTATMGQDDPSNVHKSRREGFEPCRAADHPEIAAIMDSSSRFPDAIEIGGLMLCRAPRKFMEDRKAYYDRQTRAQQEAVDNDLMKLNDARMPLDAPSRKSKVTFGSGEG